MSVQWMKKGSTDSQVIVEGWGSLTWLASSLLTNSDITVGRVIIKPGKSNPRHCHDSCEEVLYLLQGKLVHTVGDEQVEMNAGDTLVVGRGIMHNAVNPGDIDADMIVAYSSGKREIRMET